MQHSSYMCHHNIFVCFVARGDRVVARKTGLRPSCGQGNELSMKYRHCLSFFLVCFNSNNLKVAHCYGRGCHGSHVPHHTVKTYVTSLHCLECGELSGLCNYVLNDAEFGVLKAVL